MFADYSETYAGLVSGGFERDLVGFALIDEILILGSKRTSLSLGICF